MANEDVTYIPDIDAIKSGIEAGNIEQGLSAIPDVFPGILPAIAAASKQEPTPQPTTKSKENKDSKTIKEYAVIGCKYAVQGLIMGFCGGLGFIAAGKVTSSLTDDYDEIETDVL